MINLNQFTYNGKRSYDDFCLIITETPPFVFAERDVEFTSVSGRSGDIITDNGRYKNVQKEYKVTALTETYPLPLLVQKVAAWLETTANYGILTDTYDPNYFRYACYTGKISFSDKLLKLGAATLKFDCKPFKYSFEGQKEIRISTATRLWNPEDIASTPYIKIVGSGDITLTIGNSSFAFTGIEDYIEIDGDLMAAYKATELQNNKISFVDFPKFAPGWNHISFTGDVKEIAIVPRWCAL